MTNQFSVHPNSMYSSYLKNRTLSFKIRSSLLGFIPFQLTAVCILSSKSSYKLKCSKQDVFSFHCLGYWSLGWKRLKYEQFVQDADFKGDESGYKPREGTSLYTIATTSSNCNLFLRISKTAILYRQRANHSVATGQDTRQGSDWWLRKWTHRDISRRRLG